MQGSIVVTSNCNFVFFFSVFLLDVVFCYFVLFFRFSCRVIMIFTVDGNRDDDNEVESKGDEQETAVIVHENRMIFLTDACPNRGAAGADGLITLVSNVNRDSFVDNSGRVYTTFVGIGADFNSELISSISTIRGCNYLSVDQCESNCV